MPRNLGQGLQAGGGKDRIFLFSSPFLSPPLLLSPPLKRSLRPRMALNSGGAEENFEIVILLPLSQVLGLQTCTPLLTFPGCVVLEMELGLYEC